jgi:hypothetical protein
VDGVVLVLDDDGRPPRVGWLELGAATRTARVNRRLATLWTKVARRLRPRGVPGTVRLPAATIHHAGIDLRLDVLADETESLAWETWLRDHVLAHIPGSGL